MREIHVDSIRNTVKDLFLKANYVIGKDILSKIAQCEENEESPVGKSILGQILEKIGRASCRERV